MIRYIILVILGVALVSCEKTIDVDITSEPPIVVSALISDDSTWLIRVERAWGANDGAIYDRYDTIYTPAGPIYRHDVADIPKAIADAHVEITSGSGEHITLDYESYGYYVSPRRSRAGESYTLSVSVPGHPVLSSSAILPVPVPVDTAYVTVSPEKEYIVTVEFTDVPAVATYELDVWNGDDARGAWYVDEKCDDPDVHLESYLTPYNRRDGGTSTGGPNFWSISDWNFQGQKKKLVMRTMLSQYAGPNIDDIVFKNWTVRMRTLSDEFARYRATSVLQRSTSNDPFAEPVQVFNNISNGVGFFGGYSVVDYHFKLQ